MQLFVGAKALIARPDGKVLIVRESTAYDDGTEEGRWDVVGGRIETEEKLLEGLKREITEESGLEIEVGVMLGVTENFPVIKENPTHIIRVYYASTTDDDVVVLSEDHDAFDWIEPRDFTNYDLMEDVVDMFKKYIEVI